MKASRVRTEATARAAIETTITNEVCLEEAEALLSNTLIRHTTKKCILL